MLRFQFEQMFYVITLLRFYRYSNFNWLWGKLLKRKLWQIDFWCSIFMLHYRPLKVCILYSQEKQIVYSIKIIDRGFSINNLEISVQGRSRMLQIILQHISKQGFLSYFQHIFPFKLSAVDDKWHKCNGESIKYGSANKALCRTLQITAWTQTARINGVFISRCKLYDEFHILEDLLILTRTDFILSSWGRPW